MKKITFIFLVVFLATFFWQNRVNIVLWTLPKILNVIRPVSSEGSSNWQEGPLEKNNEDQFDLSALKKLKDFNKYTLKQNEDIYAIYSKDILEEKDDVIKQLTYENIYSIHLSLRQTLYVDYMNCFYLQNL